MNRYIERVGESATAMKLVTEAEYNEFLRFRNALVHVAFIHSTEPDRATALTRIGNVLNRECPETLPIIPQADGDDGEDWMEQVRRLA